MHVPRIPPCEAALSEIRTRWPDACLVAFGSYARDELMPGSDLDLLIVTDDAPKLLHQPQTVASVYVDINLVSHSALRTLTATDWYWRTILVSARVLTPCREIQSLLDENQRAMQQRSVRREMARGWSELAAKFRSQMPLTCQAWLSNAAGWHEIAYLADGILALRGGQPHIYHRHLAEVSHHLAHVPELLLRYRKFVTAGHLKIQPIIDWLRAQAVAGPHAERIEGKAQMVEDRVSWLLSLEEHSTNAHIYCKHALWVLLMFCAANALKVPLASSRTDYVSLIDRLISVPQAVRDVFGRTTPDEELQEHFRQDLKTELWNSV